MKKNWIYIILILSLISIVVLGFFACKYRTGYLEYKNLKEQEVKIYEEEQHKAEEIEKEKEKNEEEHQKFLNESVLDNKIPIGLYTRQNGKLVLTSSWYCDWSRDSIFGIFYAVASNEEEIPCSSYETTFKNYWSKNNTDGYKIGYNIKFSLDTGEVINKRILNPEDTDELFKNIQFYLYDDVTYMPGRIYYHMRQYEMTDETMLTSVKLVGYKETKGVNGPIELTVFTYNGDEDFDDESGQYLGNSKFTMKIYRQQV